jgi:hypothetical protein
MLNAEVKAKWVAALRSGKYRQGVGSLKQRDDHRHNKLCCLGVLGELCSLPGTDDNSYLVEGKALRALGGLRKKTQSKLAELNDGSDDGKVDRMSFRQIADYIEKNL